MCLVWHPFVISSMVDGCYWMIPLKCHCQKDVCFSNHAFTKFFPSLKTKNKSLSFQYLSLNSNGSYLILYKNIWLRKEYVDHSNKYPPTRQQTSIKFWLIK